MPAEHLLNLKCVHKKVLDVDCEALNEHGTGYFFGPFDHLKGSC